MATSQIRALLRKASLGRRRQRVRTALELILPLLLVAPLVAVRFLVDDTTVPAKTGVDRAVHLDDPFATRYGVRLCTNGIFAVAPRDGLGAKFREHLQAVRKAARRRGGGRAPGWPKDIVAFEDNAEVESYIAAEDYGLPGRPLLCGAVLFGRQGGSYTVRLNGTIAGNREAVCGGVDTRRPATGRKIDAAMTSKDWYLCSGFLALQRLADEFLFVTQGGLPRWRLDVDVVPFPTDSHQSRGFLGTVRELLALSTVLFFAHSAGQAAGALVGEREERLLEAMKLWGLREGARFAACLLDTLPRFVLYGLEFALALSFGLFTRSSTALLLIFFGLAGASVAAFALCASALFDSAKTASMAVLVGTFVASRLPLEALWGALLPPVAIVQVLGRIVELELADVGLSWSTCSDELGFPVSAAAVLAVLALDVPLYCLLWLYLERVVPHQFGSTKHPCFCLGRTKRLGDGAGTSSRSPHRTPVRAKRGSREASLLVEDSLPVVCTVELDRVTKVYSVGRHRVTAVNGLDLRLTDGEILALLGHNGAGKSTTVGLLTGVLQPTKGRIWVYDNDVTRQPQVARKLMGVCPQHDVLFASLTASEHLALAAALRGADVGATIEAEGLLRRVGLWGEAAATTPAGLLPSGQRRALCVALAFIGDPQFIVLDEPTSGMDPYVRRTMWDLLKQHRAGRTICLSTHYMEEAELLGDRVCILSRGSVQCYGAPEWVKARLGSGYTVTLSDFSGTGGLEEAAMKALEVVRRAAPSQAREEITVASCVGGEVTLRVPFKWTSTFPQVLRAMDKQKGSIGFKSISVSATTLEELFLRLADGEGAALLGAGGAGATGAPSGEATPSSAAASKLSGSRSAAGVSRSSLDVHSASRLDVLMGELEATGPAPRPTAWRHCSALFVKRAQSAQRNMRSILCLCFLPVVFNLLGIASIIASFELDSPPLEVLSTKAALNPKLEAPLPRMVVPFGVSGRRGQRPRLSRALLQAGATAGLWDVSEQLPLNKTLLRASSKRTWREELQIDALVLGQAGASNDEGLDLSKYREMQEKGAPEFVIKKVMEKDGLSSADVANFFAGAAGGDEQRVTATASIGLRDKVQLSVDTGRREAKVNWELGRAALAVDRSRPQLQREELATCASGGPAMAVMAEEAAKQLPQELREPLLAMQEAGAPVFAQRAYLEQEGVAATDIDVLVSAASAESMPPEQAEELQKCARWQAFAAALIDSKGESAASRYGAYFVDAVDLQRRSARVAVFYNDSASHSAPLYVALLRRAAAAASGGAIPTGSARRGGFNDASVINWPLPLTSKQRDKAVQSQGFSFLTMALIGASFLPAGIVADMVQERESGAVLQEIIAGLPLSTFVAAGLLSDMMLCVVPLLSMLGFMHAFNLAVFVDAMEVVAVVLLAFLPAVVAQVYVLAPGFNSHTSAQNSVLALNVLTGFILGTVVWILRIPFLGTTANTIARIVTCVARLLPAFNVADALLTLPNTALQGFGSVYGLHPFAWEVTGEATAALVADAALYITVAVCCNTAGAHRRRAPRRSFCRCCRRRSAEENGSAEPAAVEDAREATAESPSDAAAVRAAAETPSLLLGKGLALQGLSVSFKGRGRERRPAVEPLSLSVPPGTVLGVLGISGAGKSSLLKAIVGALPAGSAISEGSALLEGEELRGRQLRPGEVGYCPQENELSYALTVEEHVRLFGRIRGLRRQRLKAEVNTLVRSLDLDVFAGTRSENLSGGNQRKLQAACAMVGGPKLIVLDEPSAGLDPVARRALWRTTLARLGARAAPVAIIATKSTDEAEALCSKLAIFGQGGVLKSVGTALELKSRYGSGHELRLSLRRPTVAEVCASIAEREGVEAMVVLARNCVEALGGEVVDEAGLRVAATAARRVGERSFECLLRDIAGSPSWLRGVPAGVSLASVESGTFGEMLAEDGDLMKVELASRSDRILAELRRLFPQVRCVESVALSRAYRLHDERTRWNVADIFQNVEERKDLLKIADYSITQASLERVFNQLAMEEQTSASVAAA